MQFKPGEWDYLRSMQVLRTDERGRDVFAGLTLDESEEYHAMTRALTDGTFRRQGESSAEEAARRERSAPRQSSALGRVNIEE